MPTPVLRAARSDEAELLSELALRAKASWGYSRDLMKSFQVELTLTAADLDDVFVVEVGGTVAGFFSLQVVSPVRAELGHLFVEPAAQQKGLGGLLIADAIRRARARGFRSLEIQGDPNAAQFYERVGAARIGERESASVPGRMLPLFEIAIDELTSAR